MRLYSRMLRRLLALVMAWGLVLVLAAPVAAETGPADIRDGMERAWNAADWPAALTLLEYMRARVPDDQGLMDRQWRGHMNYGWDLLASGMCRAAHIQFENALGLRPGDAETLSGLALARQLCPEEIPVRVLTPVVRAPEQVPTAVPASGARPVARVTEYTVVRGDTLFSLARRFGVSVAQLQAANGLSDTDIQAGAVLRIPPPAAAGEGRTHVVRAGDTLYALALRYGTSVEALQRANRLTGQTLRVGMVLDIPESSSLGAHQVAAGETLYGIATRYGVTVQDLMSANGLTGTHIRAGQILQIPAGPAATAAPGGRTHTVRRGDTLYSLARRYGTTVLALQQANNLTGTDIVIGTVLVVP